MVIPIDSHVHLYPPEVNRDPAAWAAAQGEEPWAVLATRRRRDGRSVQGFPDVTSLLDAMDAAGVERAVLQGWYWQRAASCVLQNRFYRECVRAHPDRLSACATLHPAAGSAAVAAELRAARDDGLCGLGELSPHAQGYAPDDPVFGEALALAGDLRFPVSLHVSDPGGRDYPGRVATPLADFVRLADAFPAVHFVLAHWGGRLPLVEPAAAARANLYYDTAASPLLYDAAIWSRFAGAVGPGRILFGSDFPLNLYPGLESGPELKRLVAEVRDAGLAPDTLAGILRGNALKLFCNAA